MPFLVRLRGVTGCVFPYFLLLLRPGLCTPRGTGTGTQCTDIDAVDRHSLLQVHTSLRNSSSGRRDLQSLEASNFATVRVTAAAGTANSFGLSERLWEGWDDEPLPASNASAALVSAESLSPDQLPPMFAVAGQFDSGTNLLAALVGKNFPAAAQYDQQIRRGGLNMNRYFWKHTKPEYIRTSLRRSFAQQRVVALVMVRDPISWLQSVKKAPYELGGCTRTANWLTAPCSTPDFHDDDYRVRVPETSFHGRNIESVWNEWTRDYLRMRDFGFSDALVIRYEDLVLDTEGQLDRIGVALGLTLPTPVKQMDTPAKNHGAPNGRQAAIHKLEAKTYLDQYSPQDLRAACERVDAKMARRLHYYEDCP